MNVCFLAQDVGDLYGAERATLELAAGLRCVPYPVDARVLLIEETRLGLAGSRLREALELRGIPCSAIATSRRFSRGLVRAIREHLVEAEVDVLHCVGPKATVHGWLAARELPAVSAVATVHGWLARSGRKEWLYTRVEQALLRRFGAVVVLSRYYGQWMRRLRVPVDRVVRIPTGFDIDRWPVRAEPGPAVGRPFTVGVMARLSEEKNHRLLIEAVRRMVDRGTTLRVVLAGEGPDRSQILREIEDAGVGAYFDLRGYQDPVAFYPDVDVVALCSRLENLPYCILEAMASGLPCVVSGVGGLPDLVEDGTTGFVIEPDRVDELVDRLHRLAADRRLGERLGAAGREKLQREFTVPSQLAVHKEMYDRLCGGTDLRRG